MVLIAILWLLIFLIDILNLVLLDAYMLAHLTILLKWLLFILISDIWTINTELLEI